MKCPNCNAETTNKFCPYCGSEMPKEKSINNTNINDSSSHVINNYYYTPAPEQTIQRVYIPKEQIKTTSDKSKGLCLILCILLGYFGVHYFYVGKTGKGILYLFTIGLFGFGWLVDIFIVAFGGFKDKYGLPLK